MSADPIVYRSLVPYYVLMFAVLVTWTVIGEELSQYGLLAAVSDPMGWARMAAAIMGTMFVPVAVLSWKMKQQVSVTSLDWKLHEREIEYSEFEALLKSYYKAYSHLMSRIGWIPVAITLGIVIATVTLPYAVVAYVPQVIGIAPYLFGFLLLPFGLLAGRAVYMAAPNDASIEFPSIASRHIWRAVELLEVASGLSWAGLRLTIGEAAGYFTVRNPRAVGRIEGIESSAWIEVVVDEKGHPIDAAARVTLSSREQEIRRPTPATGELVRGELEDIIRACLRTYVSDRGSDELLDGIMEDLGIRMTADVAPESSKTHEGDAPISDDRLATSDGEEDDSERESSH